MTVFYREEAPSGLGPAIPPAVPGKNLLRDDLELPQLVLKRAELERNIIAMSKFCAERGVVIAPHVKTTMAPAIIRRQLEAGAWAATVATMQQLRVCLEIGVPRILLANELVSPHAARWLAEQLRGQTTEVLCLVDSPAGVQRLASGWAEAGTSRILPVLVELGSPGGRAGCRTMAEALGVARQVAQCPGLNLAGVEGFEGILGRARLPEDLARVDRFLELMGECARSIEAEGFFGGTGEVILSAGGSLYPDRAAAALSGLSLEHPTRVVIRSGCYVTHDHGWYEGGQPLIGPDGRPALSPALELWSEVLSVPEPGRAIAGFGRRHAPFDAGLPVMLGRLRRGVEGSTLVASEGPLEPLGRERATVITLNDQHAYLELASGTELEVGDRIVCGIVHPCTAFDHWREIPMVDENYRIVEQVETRFS